jgi:cytochrome P450
MTPPPARVRAPYDPLDAAHHADPAERLRAARFECPVSQPYRGVFVVARHADVAGALADHGAFSSAGNFALAAPGEAEPAAPAGANDHDTGPTRAHRPAKAASAMVRARTTAPA